MLLVLMMVATAEILASEPSPAALDYAEKTSVAMMVLGSQRANIELGDTDAYFNAFLPTARWIHTRGEAIKSAEKALNLPMAQARAAFRTRHNLRAGVHFERVSVEPTTSGLEMRVETTIFTRRRAIRYQDVFQLVMVNGDWRISEHRYWPLADRTDSWIHFDKVHWKSVDSDYQTARFRAPTSAEHINGLIAAKRFVEAQAVGRTAISRRATDREAARAYAVSLYEIGKAEAAASILASHANGEVGTPELWSFRP